MTEWSAALTACGGLGIAEEYYLAVGCSRNQLFPTAVSRHFKLNLMSSNHWLETLLSKHARTTKFSKTSCVISSSLRCRRRNMCHNTKNIRKSKYVPGKFSRAEGPQRTLKSCHSNGGPCCRLQDQKTSAIAEIKRPTIKSITHFSVAFPSLSLST